MKEKRTENKLQAAKRSVRWWADFGYLKGVWLLKERGHLQIGVLEGVRVLEWGARGCIYYTPKR